MIGGGGVQRSAQRWADGINSWPNVVLAFNHVCLGYSWILINVDKKYMKKSKNSEKI